MENPSEIHTEAIVRDSNPQPLTTTHNHSVCKRTFNHLA